MLSEKERGKIMNNNQENFLKELAQLFEKYSIIRAYMTDEGFELDSHNETLAFQSYVDGAFCCIRTYESQFTYTKTEPPKGE